MDKFELIFNLTNINVVYRNKSNLYSNFLQILDKEIPLIFDVRYGFTIISDKLKRNFKDNIIEYKLIVSAEDINDVEKAIEEFVFILKNLAENISVDYYAL